MHLYCAFQRHGTSPKQMVETENYETADEDWSNIGRLVLK